MITKTHSPQTIKPNKLLFNFATAENNMLYRITIEIEVYQPWHDLGVVTGGKGSEIIKKKFCCEH